MDTPAIRWRIKLKATPVAAYSMLSTQHGREHFWAEEAPEKDGVIHFRFAGGEEWDAQILEAHPPHSYAVRYFGSTTCRFRIEPITGGGCRVELTDEGVAEKDWVEVSAGWVSVLLALKAALDFGVDLRNHDPDRSWSQGYCDN